MSVITRPRIAIVGRFADSTSALRFGAVVNARALLESVWNAGGEPITLLPVAGSDLTSRLEGFGGVLLPGGGDIDPARYGSPIRADSVYDVDELQDRADLELAGYALDNAIPLLAVCRGLHVVNVLRGGTLVQDMPVTHRDLVHDVTFERSASLFGLREPGIRVSCYHHQAIERAGDGVDIVARSADGVPEAAVIEGPGWAVGVQWHPEDTAATDPRQAAIIAELVTRARSRR